MKSSPNFHVSKFVRILLFSFALCIGINLRQESNSFFLSMDCQLSYSCFFNSVASPHCTSVPLVSYIVSIHVQVYF